MREEAGNITENKTKMGRIGYRPYWAFRFSILIRAAHQVGAAVFLTAYLLETIPGPPKVFLHLVLFSGALLFLIEWLRHRQNYRELSGVTTIAKILLLGAASHGFLPTETVPLTFVLAAVVAHAPKHVRHRLLY